MKPGGHRQCFLELHTPPFMHVRGHTTARRGGTHRGRGGKFKLPDRSTVMSHGINVSNKTKRSQKAASSDWDCSFLDAFTSGYGLKPVI